jgi:hypothetical protein
MTKKTRLFSENTNISTYGISHRFSSNRIDATFEISIIQSKISDVSRVRAKASIFQTARAEL